MHSDSFWLKCHHPIGRNLGGAKFYLKFMHRLLTTLKLTCSVEPPAFKTSLISNSVNHEDMYISCRTSERLGKTKQNKLERMTWSSLSSEGNMTEVAFFVSCFLYPISTHQFFPEFFTVVHSNYSHINLVQQWTFLGYLSRTFWSSKKEYKYEKYCDKRL